MHMTDHFRCGLWVPIVRKRFELMNAGRNFTFCAFSEETKATEPGLFLIKLQEVVRAMAAN